MKARAAPLFCMSSPKEPVLVCLDMRESVEWPGLDIDSMWCSVGGGGIQCAEGGGEAAR